MDMMIDVYNSRGQSNHLTIHTSHGLLYSPPLISLTPISQLIAACNAR